MRLIDADRFIEKVNKDREHECYLHSWTADMVLERLDSWYAPTVEAIPKADYENRLKADMVAMLEEIDFEMSEQSFGIQTESWEVVEKLRKKIIQEKINALKENEDGSIH